MWMCLFKQHTNLSFKLFILGWKHVRDMMKKFRHVIPGLCRRFKVTALGRYNRKFQMEQFGTRTKIVPGDVIGNAINGDRITMRWLLVLLTWCPTPLPAALPFLAALVSNLPNQLCFQREQWRDLPYPCWLWNTEGGYKIRHLVDNMHCLSFYSLFSLFCFFSLCHLTSLPYSSD